MSYQHFYSRVPARVSLFNKTDGYDTFAHSSKLDKEFILGELSSVYLNKFDSRDALKIRRGEIESIYSQTMLPSGQIVQSALTYLPLDYTGERSAYMTHTLVLTDEERVAVIGGNNCSVFNPDMFITDVSSFNITSPAASANPSYPEKNYMPKRFVDPWSVISRFNPEAIKAFLSAIVLTLCADGKDVYFRLPCEDRRVSMEALSFINAIMSILPYRMRESLSFATYVSDFSQFPGTKLKAVGRDCEAVPYTKGVFFDFEMNVTSGVEYNIENYRPLVTFLYSLYENATLRNAFLAYSNRIFAKYGYTTINVKILNEIVFLFWQCSGYYVEETVLPGDVAVYESFVIYEKYREGLVDDHRKQVYKCLMRYSRANAPIPKDVFERLARLYPDECAPAKAVALDVLLHLIHTDIMRKELFDFIKKNYDTEQDGVKVVINRNLCRVFYGGFLQNELLDFFDAHFDKEPEQTRSVILDKILLSIRTLAVQRRIIAFIDKHYDSFDTNNKIKFYSTFLEMIPECDRLASMMIALVNRHIDKERADLRNLIKNKLIDNLEKGYNGQGHNILPLLVENNGFSDDVCVRHIFEHHADDLMYHDYVRLVASMPAYKRASKLIRVYRAVPGINEELYGKLLSEFADIEVNVGLTTMHELIKADKTADSVLPQHLAELLRAHVIYPAIVHTFYDVFKVRYGKDGIDILFKYAEGKEALTSSEQYRTIESYLQLVRYTERAYVEGAFTIMDTLPQTPAVRYDIAEHIRMCSLNRNNQKPKTSFLFELVINYLKTGNFRFDAVYSQYKKFLSAKHERILGPKATDERVEAASAAEAVEIALECAVEICGVSDDYGYLVCDDESGLGRAVDDFINLFGIGAGIYLITRLGEAPHQIREIVKYQLKKRNASISSAQDVWDIITKTFKR